MATYMGIDVPDYVPWMEEFPEGYTPSPGVNLPDIPPPTPTDPSGFNPEDWIGTNTPDFISGYDWELENPPEYGGYNPSYTPTGAPNYTGYQPQYSVTQAPGASGIDQNALLQLLSGDPAYNIDPAVTEQYFKNVIYDPAMWEYENVTRPGFLESVGNLHSGYRQNLEASTRQDLARSLSAQRAGLHYADELARRETLQNARNLQAQGVGLAQNQYGQQLQQWYQQNQLGLQEDQQKGAFDLAKWAQQSGNWQAFEKFKMETDQFKSTFDFQKWLQDSNNWRTLQELGMTQEQIQLMIEQAQLNQWLTPYELMLQALGLSGTDTIVNPGSNPFTTGVNVGVNV